MSLNRRLWLLALAGLVLRAAFLLLEPATPLVGDEQVWTNWAVKDLVTGKVRFSPLRAGLHFYPPLYPYFIAAFHQLFGGLTGVKWAQIVVSALLVPAAGRVAAAVFGDSAGFVAGAIVAFYPDLVWFSVHFWCETLFLVLLYWAIERLLAADGRADARIALAAGVLWGLATLTRETGLYLTPLAALWLGVRRPVDGGWRRGGAFLLASVLTIAPWTLRNWIVFKTFLPVGTAGGLALYQGNSGLTRDEVYERYDAVHGPIAQYQWARRMGLKAIWERQPFWIFEKLRDEMPRFWEADSQALVHLKKGAYGDVGAKAASLAWAATVLPYFAVLVLFVAGVAALNPDRRVVLLLGFLVLYNFLHVATHGFARYRLPIMPVLFCVAAHAITLLRTGAYPRLTTSRRVLAAVLAIVLCISVVPSLGANWRDPAFGFTDERESPK